MVEPCSREQTDDRHSTSEPGESRGFDGGKQITGRKRHIVVDILGLLLVVVVHSAGLQV